MRRPSLFTLVVLPPVLVALLGLVTNLASSTVAVRDEWRPWVWGVGGLVLVLLVWLEIRRARRPEPVVHTDVAQLAGVLEELAAAVRAEWQRVEVERQVADPVPLPVRWHEAPEEWVDHWSNIHGVPLGAAVSPVAMTDPRWEIAAVYRRVPSGRLVIFGGAGAGKTVLAMRLVLDLLDTRAAGDPVPVVVNAAQWDVTQLSLRDWLIVRLREDHPALAQAGPEGGTWAAGLVDAGLVVPVLDGFDEIAGEHRTAALAALNATDFPLVLTTRPGEYTSATAGRRPLSRAAGVAIDDLTVPDLVDYLPRTAGRTRGPGGVVSRWAPVLARLTTTEDEQTRTLAAALSTPLTISLARRIYSDNPDTDPAELLSATRFPTEEAVRTHLFSAFVSAVYDMPPPDAPARAGNRWRPASTRRWLGHLAVYAGGPGAGRLAWWELGRMASVRTRTILLGLIGTGASLLVFRGIFDPVLGALVGLIGGRALAFRDDALELLATAVSPARSLRATRTATLRLAVLGGPVTCLGYGWFLHATTDLPYPWALTIGPVLGLFGLLCVAPWGRWLVLVRFWLPLTGRLPWRIMAFLDDAHRRGVLRQTGTVYEFRHAKIQETLLPPRGPAWHRWRALAESCGERARAVLRRMFAEWPATGANLCLAFGLGLVATGLVVGFHHGFRVEVTLVVLAVPACVALMPAWTFSRARRSRAAAALRESPAVIRGLKGFLAAFALYLFAPAVTALLETGFRRRPDWSLLAFVVVTVIPALFAVRADHRLFGIVAPPVAVGLLAIAGADPAFVFAVVAAGVVLSLPFVARSAVVTAFCATCAAFVTGTGVVMVFLGLSNFLGADLAGVLVDVPISLIYKDSAVHVHWLSQVAFLVALVAAAVCLTRSARRRDAVGVVVSGSVFAGPPTVAAFAVTQVGPFDFATLAVFLVVPVCCVLFAVWFARRGDAALPTALCGAALVVASVQAGPLAGLPPWLAGVLIGVAGVLAWALPGIEGAALACCVLIGLVAALPGPHRVTTPSEYSGHPAAAVTFVVVAVLVAGTLVRRHPRPAVVAAATWLLLRATGTLCATLFVPAGGTFDLHPAAAQWALLTPLCLVGLPAVVLALVPRTAWAGQAAGAATLVCGALVALAPVWVLNPIAASGLDIAIPVDPVNIQAALPGEGLPAAGGVLIALLAPLAVAAIRRPHRYLTIAVVAALVAACHQLTEGFDTRLGTAGLAALLAGLALTAAALTAHALSRPTPPATPTSSLRQPS